MGRIYRPEESEWYFADYFDAAGRRHRKRVAKTAARAKDILAHLEGDVARDRVLGVRPMKRIGFTEYGEVFMEHARLQVKAWRRYETSLRVLTPFFGNQQLTAIDPESIEKFKQARALEVSQATANRDLQVLRRMMNLAIMWGYLRETPMRFVKFYRERGGRIRYLSFEEYEKLMKESPDHLRPLIVAAVNTGMRQGEMLALTWADIDFENGFVSVNDPKNGTPRKVPMNVEARAALLGIRKKALSVSVFTDATGNPLIARTLQWQFRRLLREAEIEGFRFHDLRHTCASWLAMANVAILTIRDVLGHKDIRMTMRYAHLSPDTRVDAVKRLDEFIQRKSAKPPDAQAGA